MNIVKEVKEVEEKCQLASAEKAQAVAAPPFISDAFSDRMAAMLAAIKVGDDNML